MNRMYLMKDMGILAYVKYWPTCCLSGLHFSPLGALSFSRLWLAGASAIFAGFSSLLCCVSSLLCLVYLIFTPHIGSLPFALLHPTGTRYVAMDDREDIWSRFSPLFKRLYQKERKTLKEVKTIVEGQHGFPKTPYVIKSA